MNARQLIKKLSTSMKWMLSKGPELAASYKKKEEEI